MGFIDSLLSIFPFDLVLAGVLIFLGMVLLVVGGVMARTRARGFATPVGQAGALQLGTGFIFILVSGLDFALGLGLDVLIIGLEVLVLLVAWIALPIALARHGSLFSKHDRGFYSTGRGHASAGSYNPGVASQQGLLMQQQQEYMRQNMQYQQQFIRPPGT